VTVTWSVTDPESGIATSSGCSPATISSDTPGVTITCSATNGAGLSSSASVTIKIDQTPPVISGMPPAGCELWAREQKFVRVAGVTAMDPLSGLASFHVTGTSNEPNDPKDLDDIRIEGHGLGPRTIYLRANSLGHDEDSENGDSSDRDSRDADDHHRVAKIYSLTATATDSAGNATTTNSTCTVKRPAEGDGDR
jgi:hypothetical protein